jgi:hypothetical protein
MALPLLSRSAEETLAYLRLAPCSCGETEFRGKTTLRREGEKTLKLYAGPCVRCGAARQFVFAEEALPRPTVEGKVVFGRAGTVSTLLDPGQWLVLANRAARAVTSEVDEAQAQSAMAYAVAAVEEVLQFLPPGASDFDSVPEARFVSPLGRGVLLKEPPGTFQKARLMARLQAYRRLSRRLRPSSPGVGSSPGIASSPGIPSSPGVASSPGIPSSSGVASSPGIPSTEQPLPSELPGSVVVVDRENKRLSFPTLVVGAGARDFIAAVRAAAPASADPEAADTKAPSPEGVARAAIALGVIRGYAAFLHLSGFEAAPELLPLLAAEAPSAWGAVLVAPGAAARAQSTEETGAACPLLSVLVKHLPRTRPVVVFGEEALADRWTRLGGSVPVERVTAGALAAFRAIGKAMLLSL